ncbi:MAG TPA: M20/M25/M40 family metallo-hydrolase [Gemmatimonadales bacterium]|jgi:hypothetical protein
MFRKLLLPLIVATLAPALAAQGPDSVMNARIRTEGMDHSKIMWIEHYLTDVYGPRPIGSPNHVAAANWAVKTMTDFGLKNAHLEPFTWKGVGWMPGRAVGYTTAPYTSNIKFESNPWSPSTKGTVRGDVVVLVAPVNPTEAELDAYLMKMAPKVKGGIVMVGEPQIAPVDFCPTASRLVDSVARAEFAPRDPNATPAAAGGRGGRGGGGAAACGRGGGFGGARGGRGAGEPTPEGHVSAAQVNQRMLTLVRDNMPALRLMYQGGGRIPGEIVAQNGAGQIYSDTTPQPASVILRNDDAGRIFRTTADGTPVMVEFNMQNQFFPQGKTSYVTVGEIPGTDKADEVLMLGGHLDSWTSATGATDNAIGCAIMMEAARILLATGAKPRRTIRVALWSGEEEGLLGSFAYVANHFGSAEAPKPDFNKLDAYWNIDDGTGLVRGASIFGPPAAATILAEYLKPWEEWGVYGARPTTARVEGGSDNGAFAVAGLPGIGTQQDGIAYNSTTWHSNLDTYERIIPDDVMKNAVITASVMLGLANRDEMLPRFAPSEMPKVPEAGAARGGRGVAAGGAAPVFAAPAHIFVAAKTVPFIQKEALSTPARGETMAPTAAIVSRPKHGKVIFRANGAFTYTPAAGYVGTDTFTYNLTRNGEKSTDGTVTLLVR